MTEHEKSRKHYEQSGTYDPNMEYFEECEVNSGAWVLITRQIPVDERCKPHLFGIYWGIPKQDRFDRQVCVVHTTEDVTLLNHEFTVIDDERLKVYREEGWELHENMAAADAGMNTELIEKGRALCEEERETIWAMQLDGLTETQACEEYFLTKHTEYNIFRFAIFRIKRFLRSASQYSGRDIEKERRQQDNERFLQMVRKRYGGHNGTRTGTV